MRVRHRIVQRTTTRRREHTGLQATMKPPRRRDCAALRKQVHRARWTQPLVLIAGDQALLHTLPDGQAIHLTMRR